MAAAAAAASACAKAGNPEKNIYIEAEIKNVMTDKSLFFHDIVDHLVEVCDGATAIIFGTRFDVRDGRFSRDPSPISKTVTGCDVAVAIASMLMRNKTILNVSFSGYDIGNTGMIALARAITVNDTLEKVSISKDPTIGDEGISAMGDMLMKNTHLLTLNMKEIPCGPTGTEALAKGLAHNKSLRTLRFGFIGMGVHATVSLGAMLKTNGTLRALNIHGGRIGGVGATMLSDAIAHNTSLETLKLTHCKGGDDAACAIAESLQKNGALRSLSMTYSDLAITGIEAIANSMEGNTSLQELDLSWNRGMDQCSHAIARIISDSVSMQKLTVDRCINMHTRDEEAIADAMERNTSIISLSYANLVYHKPHQPKLSRVDECLKRNRLLHSGRHVKAARTS